MHALLAWLLSQFLHGEQGALYAAAQVTESVPWLDAKLYGSTQVVDEGRHVEVFHRYVDGKLGKRMVTKKHQAMLHQLEHHVVRFGAEHKLKAYKKAQLGNRF